MAEIERGGSKGDQSPNVSAQQLLQMELAKRIAQNPRYSLRAFASALGLSPATLSLVLSGKSPVSAKTIKKMASTVEMSREQMAHLLNSIPKRRMVAFVEPQDYSTVTADVFHVLSDWYHFAILSLLEIKNANPSPRWISRKLGISVTEAKLALERLQRVNLVEEKDGQWRQSGAPLRFADEIQSTLAARQFQRQMILKALHSLDNDSSSIRDMSLITFPFSSKKFSKAIEKIAFFRRSLCEEFENSRDLDSVYTLAIQFFPLTKNSPEEDI